MKRYVTVGIIFFVLLAGAIAVSWQVFPAWQNPKSGGFWTLLGVAAIAVLGFVGKLVSVWKDLKDEDEKKDVPTPLPAPLQNIGSQNAEQIINVPGGTVTVLPPAPKEEPDPPPKGWHLKHRYALTGNFTGREAELKTLTTWLEEKDEPLFILRALGGFGKSALTWHWLLNKVDREKWTKAVWWSFYEGDASFQNFLEDTLKYLFGEDVALPSAPRAQVEMLLSALENDDILLVMDGFERALRAYSSMSAAYQEDDKDKEYEERDLDCVSPAADEFLRKLASSKGIIHAKVLMTTRLRPRAVEMRGNILNGCLEKELLALEKDDAVAFFQNQGIKGTRVEIEATCQPYGYHPLTLSILAGYILSNRSKPNDVSVAKDLEITEDIIQNKHHVLEVAYESLSAEEAKLLSTIACFRAPVEYNALKAVQEKQETKQSFLQKTLSFFVNSQPLNLDDALEKLEQRGLLHWDNTEDNNKYDLHPIVRRYAYERLTAPDRTAAHTRLRDYFEAVPKTEKIESLNDLAPVIELYHHMVRAGQFDEAYVLFRDRLRKTLFYQFGSYQTFIEMENALIDKETGIPSLKDEARQAVVFNDLANAYALNGEPRRAVPLCEMQNVLQEKRGNKKNLAIGLGNVADDQLKIGALGEAERNLRRYIELSVELEIEGENADGHAELGRALSYRGNFLNANEELDISQKYFEKGEGPPNYVGINFAYRSLLALLMARENPKDKNKHLQSAIQSAQRALELADETKRTRMNVPVDYMRAYWLLGAGYRESGEVDKAEENLSKALRICREINMVYFEADILLEVSKLRYEQNAPEEALRLAQEALVITERSGYVLQGADVNLWLAELALEGIVKRENVMCEALAREYAEKALTLAHCDDGPPYHYKVVYDEAQALLERLGK